MLGFDFKSECFQFNEFLQSYIQTILSVSKGLNDTSLYYYKWKQSLPIGVSEVVKDTKTDNESFVFPARLNIALSTIFSTEQRAFITLTS